VTLALEPKRPKRIRIGDMLVQNKAISEKQLQAALNEQKRSGHKLGATLIELGFIDEHRLLQFLSRQLEIPFLELDEIPVELEIARKLPETVARRYRVLLIEVREKDALVVMADPTDLFAYDELGRVLGKRIRQAIAMEKEVMRSLERVYGGSGETFSSIAGELHEELTQGDQVDLDQMMRVGDSGEAPVFRLLESLFAGALASEASDIHIEPDEKVLRIRQRVDGVLQERVMNEKRIAPALVQRLKLLANLDIAEKRLPQDGRFNIKVKEKHIDVRISTMPTQHGESVVMRLLDQSGGILSLDQLLPGPIRTALKRLIQKPHGLILVTGPTGSGKTTTLYSALSELNTEQRKIITVEDPVEYRLPRVNQVQVSDQIELTFARVLRTALRQDPDIILIGEMRDLETAQIGLRAAITGHLVFSTLHTNSAVGSVSRLLDMGAPGYLMASSLLAILAQRLVRRVCPACARPQEPDEAQRVWLSTLAKGAADGSGFLAGKGCNKCGGTGYKGRLGVYELIEIDAGMISALRRQDIEAFARLAAKRPGFVPLPLAALDCARQGLTSLDEVIRISSDVEYLLVE